MYSVSLVLGDVDSGGGGDDDNVDTFFGILNDKILEMSTKQFAMMLIITI